MSAGFPVLHNCRGWKDFGYFYPDHDTRAGAKVFGEALYSHADRLEAYKGHAKALTWRHSIYNPDVQNAWKDLLNGWFKLLDISNRYLFKIKLIVLIII